MGCSTVVASADVVGHLHEQFGDSQHGGALLWVADTLRCCDAVLRPVSVILSVWHRASVLREPISLRRTLAYFGRSGWKR